jgi:transcriptional regulator with XRE-family HTH domain
MAETVVDNVGQLIREARSEKALSQEALSYRAGIEQTDVSKIELGKRQPSLAVVKRIASALGMDEDTFITGE